jgi:putative spermidine/putrescine transport system substrate-binding protein
MMVKGFRGYAALLATGCLAVGVTACGSSDSNATSTTSGSKANADYPASEFPPSIYDGLTKSIKLYDVTGGTVGKARTETIFQDFKDLAGTNIVSQFTDGTAAKFSASAAAGSSPWSLVEIGDGATFLTLKKKGYLQPIDPAVVPTDDLDQASYLKGYGVGEATFGMVLAYNTKKFPANDQPSSITDIYDTKRFPGKRCLFKYHEYGAVLESALLADGVPRDQLYPLDVNRALKKLDTIKKDVVWWQAADQAVSFLLNGQCSMGIMWSGRLLEAVTKDKAPVAISWNNAITESSILAIPKAAPAGAVKSAEAALHFWTHDKKGQIALGTATGYPTPIKGVTIDSFPAPVRPFIPLGPNLTNTAPQDDQYYYTHQDQVAKQFATWLGQ